MVLFGKVDQLIVYKLSIRYNFLSKREKGEGNFFRKGERKLFREREGNLSGEEKRNLSRENL